jgi:glycerol-3-phosphate dehydrogenase (NAD(P)+)
VAPRASSGYEKPSVTTFTILGAGMMGTAFAWPLQDRGHTVRLVGTHLDREIVSSIRETGRHPKLGLEVPEGVTAHQLEELEGVLRASDVLVLGVSSAGVRWAARQLAPYLTPGTPLGMVAKGLEWDGSRLSVLPDVFLRELGEDVRDVHPVAVAGPCIAGELARRVPTAVVLASRSLDAARGFAELVRAPYYHAWPSDELIGVEVCAALKNAYAMGMAMPAGQHARAGGAPGSIGLHNLEAAVFAQSIHEMQRLIGLLGGNPHSAAWLPGVGDLDVTCNGGRTGRFGELLGRGLTPDQAREQMAGATLECLEILRSLESAVAAHVTRGELDEGDLPLARHLWRRALYGIVEDWPVHRFFKS